MNNSVSYSPKSGTIKASGKYPILIAFGITTIGVVGTLGVHFGKPVAKSLGKKCADKIEHWFDEKFNKKPIESKEECHTPATHTTDEVFVRSNDYKDGWIVDKYARIGQITMVAAGGGVGKSLWMTSVARAVALGERPEFLPHSCQKSDKQHVLFYRLEDFARELNGKYGEGKYLRDCGNNIEWVFKEDLKSLTIQGLLDHLKGKASAFAEDTVVFIDPATKLNDYKHKLCIKGIEEAQDIATKRGITLSAVVSIHTDEIKDWKSLTSEDIKGGDAAIEQAGALLALRRESTEDGTHRFIQVLKEPKGCPTPFNGEVLVCKQVHVQDDDVNWSEHYVYDCTKSLEAAMPKKPKTTPDIERDLSCKRAPNLKMTPETEKLIDKLHAQGCRIKKIAKRCKLCEKTISRYLNGK